MKQIKLVQVDLDTLRDLIERIFIAIGFKNDLAAQVAEVYMEAEIRGHGIQGLEHMIYNQVRTFASRRFNPDGRPEIVKEMPAYALVDGNRGAGQVTTIFGAQLAVRLAKSAGCCAVGIANSGDLYLAGYYPEIIARAGLVGLLFSDGLPLVHATGGADRVLGTNPLAIAVPTDSEDPILLDMATCTTLYDEIQQAARSGETIRQGIAVDENGVSTSDPVAALAGALSPIAGHKGYGLALCVGLLSGPLVGCEVGKATGEAIYTKSLLPTGEQSLDIWQNLGKEQFGPAGRKGHLILAIDPAAFGNPGDFKKKVSNYVREIKNSRRAPGVAEILMPGERSFRTRKANLARGCVDILETVWRDTGRLCDTLGIAFPSS